MRLLKLPVGLLLLSVVLKELKATPIARELLTEGINTKVPLLSRNVLLELRETKPKHATARTTSDTGLQVDKRKCNTATCATQRLTTFLVRSSHNLGAVLLPTDVGSNTYGKRNAAEVLDRELLHALPL